MKTQWLPVTLLALASCGQETTAGSSTTALDWCEEFYAGFDASELVDPRTGRVERDPTTNEILDPGTGRVGLTRREEDCVRREAQKAIDAYEGS